eukprot:12680293-Ditylum_brightwellii.AAC.1
MSYSMRRNGSVGKASKNFTTRKQICCMDRGNLGSPLEAGVNSKRTGAKYRTTSASVNDHPSNTSFFKPSQRFANVGRKQKKDKDKKKCAEDLKLMFFFLQEAKKGVSMIFIAHKRPTHVYRSDSCPGGLGSYSHEGWTWRFYLPGHLQFRAPNNLLEHIAAVIILWVNVIEGRLDQGDCSLLMTDSSTSEGWLKKSNFSKLIEDQIQVMIWLDVCRNYAMRMMKNDIKYYTARAFQNCQTAKRNCLLADLAAAETTFEGVVMGKTHKDQAWVWRQWEEYAESIGVDNDIYLDSLSRGLKINIMGAFAMALCEGRFPGEPYDSLAEDIVRGALSYVA